MTNRKPVVVVAARSLHHPEAVRAHFGPEVDVRFEEVATPEQVARATAEADAIVVASQPLDAARIDALGPGIKVIARTGVGVDTVDLEHAAELGVRGVLGGDGPCRFARLRRAPAARVSLR